MNFKQCNDLNLRRSAEIYTAAGLRLTPLVPGTKKAYLTNWQQPGAGKTDATYWDYRPADNIGMLLYGSGIVVLDIDDKEAFLRAMEAVGMDQGYQGQPPFYRSNTAGIHSGRKGKGKLIFRRPSGPAGDKLEYHKLIWKDSTGKSYTVFELRTGAADHDIQDVLPPSIHPDTGKPYRWIGGDIEPLPYDLRLLWENWDVFFDDLIQADPNYTHEPLMIRRGRRKAKQGDRSATELIGEWNNGHNIISTLEQYGYTHAYGNRYLSPHSRSMNPGVLVHAEDNTCFNFGESDPLTTEHKIKPFDLMLEYEFKGDLGAAIRYIKTEMYPEEDTAHTAHHADQDGPATAGTQEA